ncbi:MAG: formylglycine-generating enzyme family protein [Oceanipulchritudo sp.]
MYAQQTSKWICGFIITVVFSPLSIWGGGYLSTVQEIEVGVWNNDPEPAAFGVAAIGPKADMITYNNGLANEGIASDGNVFYTSRGFSGQDEVITRWSANFSREDWEVVQYYPLASTLEHLGDLTVRDNRIYVAASDWKLIFNGDTKVLDIAWFDAQTLEYLGHLELGHWSNDYKIGGGDFAGLDVAAGLMFLVEYQAADSPQNPRVFILPMVNGEPVEMNVTTVEISTREANGIFIREGFAYIPWGGSKAQGKGLGKMDVYNLTDLMEVGAAEPIDFFWFDAPYIHAEGLTFRNDELWVAQNTHVLQLETPDLTADPYPWMKTTLKDYAWRKSDWFGNFQELSYPTVWHQDFGWITVDYFADGALYFFDEKAASWFWVFKDDPKILHKMDGYHQGWYWYSLQNSKRGDPAFFDIQEQSWRDSHEIRLRQMPEGMVRIQGGQLYDGEPMVPTFEMGRYEVTWGEWKTVENWALLNGYDLFWEGFGCRDNHPVVAVNLFKVLKWCNAKSEMEGLVPVYTLNGEVFRTGEEMPEFNSFANGYRLPTPSERTFATSGGIFSQDYLYSGSDNENLVAWNWYNAVGAECDFYSGNGTWPVGLKLPNEIGLYDMSGNVTEWCWDGNYNWGVMGGSFMDYVLENLILAPLDYIDSSSEYADVGFRLTRSVPLGEELGFSSLLLVQGDYLSTSSGVGSQSISTFFIGQTEVTWREWCRVRFWAGANGYDIANAGEGCYPTHPVHSVSWYDVLKWCNAKTEMENTLNNAGLTVAYTVNGQVYRKGKSNPDWNENADGFRLLREAEWEFAARGGSLGGYYTYSGSNNIDAVGWYSGNSGNAFCNLFQGRGTWAVASKEPNQLELYDMTGNVWEWCWDTYEDRRLIRGGSWNHTADQSKLTQRYAVDPNYNGSRSGLRVARTP